MPLRKRHAVSVRRRIVEGEPGSLPWPIWAVYQRISRLFSSAKRTEEPMPRSKLDELRRLEGRWVALGLGSGRGMIAEYEGFLHQRGNDFVLDDGESERHVPIGQIRWVTDPTTDARIGGPW